MSSCPVIPSFCYAPRTGSVYGLFITEWSFSDSWHCIPELCCATYKYFTFLQINFHWIFQPAHISLNHIHKVIEMLIGQLYLLFNSYTTLQQSFKIFHFILPLSPLYILVSGLKWYGDITVIESSNTLSLLLSTHPAYLTYLTLTCSLRAVENVWESAYDECWTFMWRF